MFPSNSGKASPYEAVDRIERIAGQIKASAQSLRNDSAAAPILARYPVNTLEALVSFRTALESLTAVVGVVAAARQKYADANFDIVAEYQTMKTQLDAVISWIATNIPKDAGNRWLALEEIVGNVRVDRTLSVASTAGLRTQLDALIATID